VFTAWRAEAMHHRAVELVQPRLLEEGGRGCPESLTTPLVLSSQEVHELGLSWNRYPRIRYHSGIETGLNTPYGAGILDIVQTHTSQVKWTRTISNHLLLEAAGIVFPYYYNSKYQPTVRGATCFTAAAACTPNTDYSDISHFNITTGITDVANQNPAWNRLWKDGVMAALSYVTGTHALKAGFTFPSDQSLEYRNTRLPIIAKDRNVRLTGIRRIRICEDANPLRAAFGHNHLTAGSNLRYPVRGFIGLYIEVSDSNDRSPCAILRHLQAWRSVLRGGDYTHEAGNQTGRAGKELIRHDDYETEDFPQRSFSAYAPLWSKIGQGGIDVE